jgi:hypothetical protein
MYSLDVVARHLHVRQEVIGTRQTLVYIRRDCLFHTHKIAEMLKRLIVECNPNISPDSRTAPKVESSRLRSSIKKQVVQQGEY